MKRVLLTAFVLVLSLVLPPRLFERFWIGQERAAGQTLTEFLRSRMGRAGILLFLTLLSLSVYVLIAYPSDFGKQEWNNPEHWADNPKVAAPSWVRLFDGERTKHQIFESTASGVESEGSGTVHRYQFPVEVPGDTFPSFVSFSVVGVTFEGRSPLIELYFRAGDKELLLHRHVVPGPRQDETAPILRYQEVPYRVNLTSDLATRKKIEDFLVSLSQEGIEEFSADILVSVAGEGDGAQEVRLVFGGDVYGLLGTDTIGRDVFQGILAGLPIALLIALVPTLMATAMGASLGAISGYFHRGIIDTLIQRFTDVIVSIPALPILVFLTFIFGPKLSNIVLILAAFGWTGLAIQLRPMVVQIRASGFIDYLRAKGFGTWRIIFRHVLPQTFPFIFAYFILAAPGAILAEAGLSFLGLGDPSLVTWGQMLQQGYGTGAVYLGYWWWIIPPGAMIVITALTFFMLSIPLEVIATPRLRRE